MDAGKVQNKHGVGILLNRKWRQRIKWTEHINERAIAKSITVNTQRIMLMSVYVHDTGHADHHVESANKKIEKRTKIQNEQSNRR